MKKLAMIALFSSLPFTVLAVEEPAPAFSPSQSVPDINNIIAVSAEDSISQAILSTEEITKKLAVNIQKTPSQAAALVEAAIKTNPGLASIDIEPSLAAQVTATAVKNSPQQTEAIVGAAIDAKPDETVQIAQSAIQENPSKIADIVKVAVSKQPDQAAEIVRVAVESNPSAAEEIIAAATAAGANQDEMLVAALIGGADESILGQEETAAGPEIFIASLGQTPSSTDFGGGTGSGSDDNASRN